MTFLSFLISGISLGSIYAIIALGYTMVYGIAKMLNFAHGDVIMVGAYICFYATTRFELPAIVGVILAIIVCTVLGIVIERLAYKPLRAAPILAVLITAIGVSYFLQNAALLLWSSNPKVFTSVIPKGNISLFGGQLTIPYVTLVTIVVCIIIMIALVWFTSKTKMGKAMRACSEDKGAAQLMGINVNGLSHSGADHRLHAWYQGLYGGRVRRHRVHPRRSAGRRAAGHHRDLCQGLYLHPALGRHCVRGADRGADRAAGRPAGQAGPRESVRWLA